MHISTPKKKKCYTQWVITRAVWARIRVTAKRYVYNPSARMLTSHGGDFLVSAIEHVFKGPLLE